MKGRVEGTLVLPTALWEREMARRWLRLPGWGGESIVVRRVLESAGGPCSLGEQPGEQTWREDQSGALWHSKRRTTLARDGLFQLGHNGPFELDKSFWGAVLCVLGC